MADLEIIRGQDNGNPPDTLRQAYPKINRNFQNIDNGLKGHIASKTAHKAEDITYSGETTGSNVKQAIDGLDSRIDNIVAQSGNDNTEIKDARGGFPVLSARLDKSDAQFADIANPPRAKYTGNYNKPAPSSTWTSPGFNVKVYDTDGFIDPKDDTNFIVNTSGLYLISAQVMFSSNNTGVRNVRLTVNGTHDVVYSSGNANGNGYAYRASVSGIAYINAAESIRVLAFQDTGNALDLIGAGAQLTIVRIMPPGKDEAYRSRLYAPTQISKLNGKYFIVDCWHHRVIWTNDKTKAIKDWNTVDVEFAGPHAIASDGDIYVVDNTGYHEVIVLGSDLKFRQRISGVGYRPHKTIYDASTQAFYVVAAPYIFCFKKTGGLLYLHYQKHLVWLDNTYVRSISIINGKMYFVSGPGKIVVVEFADESYTIINEYIVPNELNGMNDIYKVGSYYYITATQNNLGVVAPKIVRLLNLSNLASSNYEDIYSTIGFSATPYYVSVFDNRVYITEIGDKNGVFSFPVSDTSLTSVTHDFSFIGQTTDDVKRNSIYPT